MNLIYFRVEQSPWSCFRWGCKAISMCFGVGKPATTRQTSWARLITCSYCLGLTGHHHPPRGGIRYQPCHSVDILQLILSDASKYDTFISGFNIVHSIWVSMDFQNSFLKNVSKNMAPSLKRDSSRHDTNCVITASHELV